MTARAMLAVPPEEAVANPVLPGFYPDPSIVRVGGWYYIANSSFEWFPAVPIHRSRDLKNWEYAGSLNGPDIKFDFSGIQDSGSIWAPSLSWDAGTFWLTFTVVRSFGGEHKDMDTYISRAHEVQGPWSAPQRVSTTGFDPSIFHHAGRHWLANMEWDHRPGPGQGFAGITLQELNADGTTTLTVPRNILQTAVLTEGPNLYCRDGWFYLLVAEGGTGWNHGIRTYRSRHLHGPYDSDPGGPLLTTRDAPSHPLQKAGHGELVDTPDGSTYLVHLASRCIKRQDESFALLGRETCLQEIDWNATGWPRLKHGGHHPAPTVPSATPAAPAPARATSNTGFPSTGDPLHWPWNTLRTPGPKAIQDGWLSTTARPGWLRLTGRRSTDSLWDQSLIAQRITNPSLTAQVTLEAAPENYTQSAGLILYYNTSAYFYLRASSEGGQRVMELWERDTLNGLVVHATKEAPDGLLHLRASLSEGWVQFHFTTSPRPQGLWTDIGPRLDAAHLSDDYGGQLRFTGPFVGVCAQDLRDQTFIADFRDFSLA